MHFLFISGGEILFIIFIAVMVFGADKIPEVARGLGKGMRQLRDATDDIKREIQKSAEKQGVDTDFVNDIKKEVDQVKKNVSDVGREIQKTGESKGVGPNITKDIQNEISQVTKTVEGVGGSIKRDLK